MGRNYIFSGVVLLKGEDSGILVERETYKDLIKKDRIPGWLN